MRKKLRSHLVLLFLSTVLAGSVAQAQGDLRLVTIDRDFPKLHHVDPLTGLAVSPVTADITINLSTSPPDIVVGGTGLANDPMATDGLVFALLRIDGTQVRTLAKIDPFFGDATTVGPADNGTGLSFAEITFSSDGKLYGVTSDSSPSPASLFVIDKLRGNATLVRALGNGGAGEAIAFNPGDNLIYHASGPEPVFETLDPALPLKPPVNVPVSVQPPGEPTSLTHFRGDYFLWSDVDASGLGSLFLVKKDGSARFLSFLDNVAGGMALIGSPPACPPSASLYGSAHQGPNGPALLYAIDPTNGAPSMIGPMGFERVGGIAFRGSDGKLFGAGERMNGSNTGVLLTIDTCSGLGTEVGPILTALAGPALGTVFDLSFRPDNTLFAMASGATTMRLATINTSSGLATIVGPSASRDSSGNGLAFQDATTLWTSNTFEFAGPPNLSKVDPSTGTLTTPLPVAFSGTPPALNALDFQPGSVPLTLFASQNVGVAGAPENFLSTVDTGNGQVTILGQTQNGLDGIAFVPSGAAPGPADVQISNIAPANVTAGQSVMYTITVSLASAGTATGVFLTDQLPAALRNPVASTTQGSCSQGAFVLCNLGTISFGSSVTITITAAVVVSTGNASISNTASVTSAGPDSNQTNNSAMVTTTISAAPIVDLAVDPLTHSPADPTPTPVGKTLSFSTTVRNNGGGSAGSVTLYFTFSSRVAFISGTAGCVSVNLNITCNVNPLLGGQTKTFSINVAPSFVRSVTATATVLSSSTTDTTPGNDTASGTAAQVRPRPFTRPAQGLRIP